MSGYQDHTGDTGLSRKIFSLRLTGMSLTSSDFIMLRMLAIHEFSLILSLESKKQCSRIARKEPNFKTRLNPTNSCREAVLKERKWLPTS
jgi:hypothetical protein